MPERSVEGYEVEVSVIIPTFNRADVLGGALQSVLAQKWPSIETIVIDDCSTDNTREVVAAFSRAHPEINLKLLSTPKNSGPAAARNVGLRAARGQFIAFLDSDDEWTPGSLEKRLAVLKNRPEIGMVFADMRNVDKNGVVGERWVASSFRYKRYIGDGSGIECFEDLLVEENYVSLPTVVLRRAVLRDVGLFDEARRCGEDHDLWLRVAVRHRARYLDEVVLMRHIRPDSLSRVDVDRFFAQLAFLKELPARYPALYERNRPFIVERMAGLEDSLAYLLFDQERFKEANVFSLNVLSRRISRRHLWLGLATFLPDGWIRGLRRFKRLLFLSGRP